MIKNNRAEKEFVSRRGLTYSQMVGFGFFCIILVGTFLLMLPVSSRDGTVTNFTDAFFTATSATCVTGLVVYDTYLHWSLFGQILIILLIPVSYTHLTLPTKA